MEKEQKLILEMVAAKKLTVEQADQLLEALDAGDEGRVADALASSRQEQEESRDLFSQGQFQQQGGQGQFQRQGRQGQFQQQ